MFVKRICISFLFLLSALLLALTIYAQQPTTTQPAQISAPSSSDFIFTNVIADRAMIGQHVVNGGIHFMGPVVLGDSGEVVFEGDFYDNAAVGKAGPARGIYTNLGRVVIEEGANLGGASILQIVNTQPRQLQINRLGQISYLAIIQGRGCPLASCYGLFVEKQLIAVSTAGLVPYLLTDTGQIQAPVNSPWFLPAKGGVTLGGSGGRSKLSKAVSILAPTIRIPPLGIPLPGRPPIVVTPPVIYGGQIPAPQPGQVAQGEQLQQARFPAMPIPVTCHVPVGFSTGFMSVWPQGADAAGPIGSVQPDGPFSGQVYKSALHPGVGLWTRKVYYAYDCRVVMAAMGIPGMGAQELWSPSGLIGSFDGAEGAYKFNGVSPVALPPANMPIEDSITISRRCRVLIPVMFKRPWGEEPALIVGTPTKPGRCSGE